MIPIPFKDMFYQKKEQKKDVDAENDKLKSKMNALDVHIKRLLKLEQKIQPLLKIQEELKRQQEKENSRQLRQTEIYEDVEKRILSQNTRIEKYNQKVDKLEKQLIEGSKEDFLKEKARSISNESTYLRRLPEFFKKMEMLDRQIFELEKNIKILKVHQQDQIFKLSELEEKMNKVIAIYEKQPTANKDQEVVIKEIHIDKFYLDKYEQNNNFAQLGIKSLSGSLNIGATYGKDVIPKEITDQLKDEIEDIKEMKSEFKPKEQDLEESTHNESEQETAHESSAFFDENNFTEVPIEGIPDEEDDDSQ